MNKLDYIQAEIRNLEEMLRNEKMNSKRKKVIKGRIRKLKKEVKKYGSM